MRLLKKYRLASGMTLEQVASRVGVKSASTVGHWECGRFLPQPKHIKKLAAVFCIKAMDMVEILCPDEPHPGEERA